MVRGGDAELTLTGRPARLEHAAQLVIRIHNLVVLACVVPSVRNAVLSLESCSIPFSQKLLERCHYQAHAYGPLRDLQYPTPQSQTAVRRRNRSTAAWLVSPAPQCWVIRPDQVSLADSSVANLFTSGARFDEMQARPAPVYSNPKNPDIRESCMTSTAMREPARHTHMPPRQRCAVTGI